MYKIEMYFGRNRKNDVPVKEYEWLEFLVDDVTPRFPDGFTVLESWGQYKGKDGVIICERGNVLILVVDDVYCILTSDKICEIRDIYCDKFKQESVMVTVAELEVSF